MQKRIVIKNGKKYIVNTPGWEDGIGPGAPFGTLWMLSTDGNWYEVTLNGTSGSFANSSSLVVNQTPLTWASNDSGYQLLLCPQDNLVYQAYLSGSAGDVTMSISQVPSGSAMAGGDYKPYLLMRSTVDRYFYPVYAKSGSIYLFTDQNARVWMDDGIEPLPLKNNMVLFVYGGSIATRNFSVFNQRGSENRSTIDGNFYVSSSFMDELASNLTTSFIFSASTYPVSGLQSYPVIDVNISSSINNSSNIIVTYRLISGNYLGIPPYSGSVTSSRSNVFVLPPGRIVESLFYGNNNALLISHPTQSFVTKSLITFSNLFPADNGKTSSFSSSLNGIDAQYSLISTYSIIHRVIGTLSTLRNITSFNSL